MIKRIACNIDDYQSFFALNEHDLTKKIVEFSSGFNSFNVNMKKKQNSIISCDPCYQLTIQELQKNQKALEQTLRKDYQEKTFPFSFQNFADFTTMLQHHQNVTADFSQDYLEGVKSKRYRCDTLQKHNFSTKSFQLLLLHYLFAQSRCTLEEVFINLQAALKLAPEVRVFPLLDENANHPELLAPLCLLLQQNGWSIELKKVEFEWQMQGHVLLIIKEQFCIV